MSEHHIPQELNANQIVNNLEQLPLAYGLEFDWGGFAVTEAADEFYGLQVNSLDTRLTGEQFRQIPSLGAQRIVRPRFFLASPNELPASMVDDAKEYEQSVRILSYGANDDPLSVWLSHSLTPEEQRREFWQTCVNIARDRFGDPELTDEQISQRVVYSEPGKTLALNNVTANHAARLQLSQMVEVMVDKLPTIATEKAIQAQEKQFSQLVRQTGARLLASTAVVSSGVAMLVPGESAPLAVAKAVLPVGMMAASGTRAFRMQREYNKVLIEGTMSLMSYWQSHSDKVGDDIESAYSGEGFNEQMLKMLGK